MQDLPYHVRVSASEDTGQPDTQHPSLPEVVHALARHMILRALERHGRVQTQAAAARGISDQVLRYKLQQHGLQAWLVEGGVEPANRLGRNET